MCYRICARGLSATIHYHNKYVKPLLFGLITHPTTPGAVCYYVKPVSPPSTPPLLPTEKTSPRREASAWPITPLPSTL